MSLQWGKAIGGALSSLGGAMNANAASAAAVDMEQRREQAELLKAERLAQLRSQYDIQGYEQKKKIDKKYDAPVGPKLETLYSGSQARQAYYDPKNPEADANGYVTVGQGARWQPSTAGVAGQKRYQTLEVTDDLGNVIGYDIFDPIEGRIVGREMTGAGLGFEQARALAAEEASGRAGWLSTDESDFGPGGREAWINNRAMELMQAGGGGGRSQTPGAPGGGGAQPYAVPAPGGTQGQALPAAPTADAPPVPGAVRHPTTGQWIVQQDGQWYQIDTSPEAPSAAQGASPVQQGAQLFQRGLQTLGEFYRGAKGAVGGGPGLGGASGGGAEGPYVGRGGAPGAERSATPQVGGDLARAGVAAVGDAYQQSEIGQAINRGGGAEGPYVGRGGGNPTAAAQDLVAEIQASGEGAEVWLERLRSDPRYQQRFMALPPDVQRQILLMLQGAL